VHPFACEAIERVWARIEITYYLHDRLPLTLFLDLRADVLHSGVQVAGPFELRSDAIDLRGLHQRG
jgi:hypothetical protein